MNQDEKLLYLPPFKQPKKWRSVFIRKNQDKLIDEPVESKYLMGLKKLLEARITIAKL